MLLSNDAISLVTKPTRVANKTATIIDHIVTNDFKHQISPEILDYCDISDHYPTICKIDAPQLSKKQTSQSFSMVIMRNWTLICLTLTSA